VALARCLDDDRPAMAGARTKDYGRQYRALWPELGPALERLFGPGDEVVTRVDTFAGVVPVFGEGRQ
jgi:hypothetical protein